MQAHDEDVQLWLGQSLSHPIDADTSIAFDLSERLREAAVGGDQTLGRITLTQRIAPGVEIALGASASSNDGIGEIRPEQALILTHGVLTLRSRLEERLIDGVQDIAYRLRERLAVNVPLDGKARWIVIASGEAFFLLNRTRPGDVTGFNMLRTQLGLRHALTPALSATALYQRQQTVRPGRDDSVAHIPVLVLGWSF